MDEPNLEVKNSEEYIRTKLQTSETVPPPKHSRSGAVLLRNRLTLCSLSICLMWASSLRTAAYISSFAIDVPQAKRIYGSCRAATQIIILEEENFSTCVDQQMKQCELDLETAISIERERVNVESGYNSYVVNSARQTAENSTENFTLLKRSLEEWLAKSQLLPPRNDTSCSKKDREVMMSTVFDVNVLRSEALAVSAGYRRQSTNAMQNIVDYAKIRSEYDVNYAKKYVDLVSEEVQSYASLTKLPELKVKDELNKIQNHIDDLLSCTTIYEGRKRCEFPSLDLGLSDMWEQYVDETKGRWEAVYEYWNSGYREFADQTFGFVRKVSGGWSKLNEFAQKSATWFNNPPCNGGCAFVISEVKASLASGVDILGPFGLGFSDEVLNAYQNMMDFELVKWRPPNFYLKNTVQDIELLKKIRAIYADRIWPKVESAYNNLTAIQREQFNEAKAIVWNTHSDFMRDVYDIKQNVRILPTDYKPPTYKGSLSNITDLSQEKNHYEGSSQQFILESTTSINTIANSNSYNYSENLTLDTSQVNLTGVNTTPVDFEFNFERLTSPDIAFDIWFLQFSSLSDIVFIVDFAVRIYFSIRMCYRCWRVSEVNIPHVDVRTQKEVRNPFRMSNGRIVVLFFTNPLVGAILGAIVLLLTVTGVASIYLPLYTEYQHGCIPLDGSGTFVSKNVYSSAYNFAYREGSSSLVKTLDELEVLKSNICSSMYTWSSSKQSRNIVELASDLQTVDRVTEHMGAFEKCIDFQQVDDMFLKACCNETGYSICDDDDEFKRNLICPLNYFQDSHVAFQPPGHYLLKGQSHSFDLNNNGRLELNNAIFDCSALPMCDTTCVGPHKDKIQQITKECSCIAEWLLHSSWLRWILTVFIFAVLNISRITFIDGLARLIWKHLHPGTFTVLATCDIRGSVLLQDDIRKDARNDHGESSPSIRLSHSIQKEIEWNSMIFRSIGVIMILFSLALNAIWIMLVLHAPDATEIGWIKTEFS